jgi:phosphoribosyl 1,2-cyclic phosphodiesterase
LYKLFGSINIEPSTISAILVTHEHSDHVKGLGLLSSKYDIPIYTNNKTWEAMNKSDTDRVSSYNRKSFNISQNFKIGDLEIFPFSIPHDAADPCGFNVYHERRKN